MIRNVHRISLLLLVVVTALVALPSNCCCSEFSRHLFIDYINDIVYENDLLEYSSQAHLKELTIPYNFVGSGDALYFNRDGSIKDYIEGDYSWADGDKTWVMMPRSLLDGANIPYILVEQFDSHDFCSDSQSGWRDPIATYTMYDMQGTVLWTKKDIASEKLNLFRNGYYFNWAERWDCHDQEGSGPIHFYGKDGSLLNGDVKINTEDTTKFSDLDLDIVWCLFPNETTLHFGYGTRDGQTVFCFDYNGELIKDKKPLLYNDSIRFINKNHLIYGISSSRHLLDTDGNVVLLNDLLSDSFGLKGCGIFFNSSSTNSGKDSLLFEARYCPRGTTYNCLLTLSDKSNVSYCIEIESASIIDLTGNGENIIYSERQCKPTLENDYCSKEKSKIVLYMTDKSLLNKTEIDSWVSFSGSTLLKLSDDCFMAIGSQYVRAYCR